MSVTNSDSVLSNSHLISTGEFNIAGDVSRETIMLIAESFSTMTYNGAPLSINGNFSPNLINYLQTSVELVDQFENTLSDTEQYVSFLENCHSKIPGIDRSHVDIMGNLIEKIHNILKGEV